MPGTVGRPAWPHQRVRGYAYCALTVLGLTALAAATAAAAESWRYVLLLRSRTHLLSAGVVAASDTLTDVAGVLAVVFGVLAAIMSVGWLYRARQLAATRRGHLPTRPTWLALTCPFVPGPNLFLPFSVLAELEHDALGRDTAVRPHPTRPLWAWWAAWVASALLFLATLLADQRGGVQALADGVLLHAVLDTVAVAVAVLTGLVVARTTRLLSGSGQRARRFRYVVRVSGAPAPSPATRRPAGAPR